MNMYKFRSECQADIENFVDILKEKNIYYILNFERDKIFPDCDAQIEIDVSLDKLREFMRLVVNGHVMVQTVQSKNSYTGERNYSL